MAKRRKLNNRASQLVDSDDESQPEATVDDKRQIIQDAQEAAEGTIEDGVGQPEGETQDQPQIDEAEDEEALEEEIRLYDLFAEEFFDSMSVLNGTR